MKFNSLFIWFFIVGGFVTAAAAVWYFASGLSYRGTDAENYTILLQIPLGVVTSLYGIDKITDARQKQDR